jgi:hypothetical protein
MSDTNGVSIDQKHSRAICQEIGERLRIEWKEAPPMPRRLSELMERLQQLDPHDAPSIAPGREVIFRERSIG